MSRRIYASATIGFAALAALAVAAPAFAQTNPSTDMPVRNFPDAAAWQGKGQGKDMTPGGTRTGMRPGVFGTVSAISGTTLTVSSKQAPVASGSTAATVTYTVDASNATVKKDNATSTLSAIAVGDTVAVQGTVTGTNVVATTIRDGVMARVPGQTGPNGQNDQNSQGKGRMASSTPSIQGNGEPVVAGTLSAVNGSSLTVSTKSNVTYTVDASSAKIVQGKNTVSVSGLTVGDSVVVQGAVSGTSIAASSVIDQPKPTSSNAAHSGFFGGIGAFFSHLFGF